VKPILAPGGKVRAYIKETADGRQLLAPGGRLLGYYYQQKDHTILPGERLHGYEDQLMDLLED